MDSISGIPTGYEDLDRITQGMHGAEMIILAARPGIGKTALALNIAVNVSRQTKKEATASDEWHFLVLKCHLNNLWAVFIQWLHVLINLNSKNLNSLLMKKY